MELGALGGAAAGVVGASIVRGTLGAGVLRACEVSVGPEAARAGTAALMGKVETGADAETRTGAGCGAVRAL